MTPPELREAYLRWVRRAAPALLLPLALTAAVQAASTSEWWSGGPVPDTSGRFLFVAVAAAALVAGHSARTREAARRPVSLASLVSLSWTLLTCALMPVAIGAVLAFVTRQVWDFYLLLAITLGGFVYLFPRYVQWAEWSGTGDGS
jgi:hypothetical protein